jgi:hypothetical protein
MFLGVWALIIACTWMYLLRGSFLSYLTDCATRAQGELQTVYMYRCATKVPFWERKEYLISAALCGEF